MRRTRLAMLIVLSLAIIYLGAYALARGTGLLVHRKGVIAWEETGRDHAVCAVGADRHCGTAAEIIFFPLRMLETGHWNRQQK